MGKTKTFVFRTTEEQNAFISRVAAATGKRQSEVLRDMIDAAAGLRPVTVSAYQLSATLAAAADRQNSHV